MRLHNKDKCNNLVQVKITASFMSQKTYRYIVRAECRILHCRSKWKIVRGTKKRWKTNVNK